MTSVLGVLASPGATAVRMLPLLADAAIKGVIIFGLAGVAVALLRRRSAATRHAIWAGAVVAQLALPILSALLPAWRVPIVDQLEDQFAIAPAAVIAPPGADVIVSVPISEAPAGEAMRWDSGDRTISEARIARAEARAARAAARRARGFGGVVASGIGVGFGQGFGGSYAVAVTRPSRVSRMLNIVRGRNASWWLRAVAVVWLLGAIGILARFLAGTLAVSRLARRSERVEDGRWLSLGQRVAIRLGVARPMTLLRSGRFDVPVTWGIVYPVVLLPDGADEWTDERRRYVLVHEMAHVKRVDAFTQLIAQFAIAFFWFDPLVWMAAHRMRVEREHACDDYVLREGTPASTYAADLLAMVRSLGLRGRSAQPAFAALAMARPDELESRMDAILDPGTDRRSLRNAPALGVAMCSLLLLLPLAAFRPFGARPMHSFAMTHFEPMPAAADMVPEMQEMQTLPEHLRAIGPELQAKLAEVMAGQQAAEAARASVSAALVATRASLAAIAPVPPVPPVAATPALAATRASSWSSSTIASCSSMSLHRSGSSTSIHTSSDDDDSSFQYINSSAGRCLQVAVWGHVEFSDDDREIRSISRDGRLYVRERKPDVDREVEVTAGDGNQPRYAYTVNGERASFEDEGQEWFGSLLPEILRESGLNAPERVARLRHEGGVSAVLASISKIESTSAKRSAYEALLKEGNLSPDEMAEVARHAGEDLSSSDGELRAVLEQMGTMNRGRRSSHMADAFSEAVGRMSSDGEKRALLQQYAVQGDRDMLLVSGRQAKSISSDGEKSGYLCATAERYLSSDDEALTRTFFDVTQTISSDGEKREVLMKALPFATRQPVLMSILDGANSISSDGEKSELLVAILRRKVLTSQPARDAFMKTTRSISSDSEYRRVMDEAITADRR